MTTQRRIGGVVQFSCGLALMMSIAVVPAWAGARPRLTDVSITTSDATMKIAVTTGGAAKYHAALMDPRRIVVDLDDTQYAWRETPLTVDREPVKEIRGSQFRRGIARLVVQLSRAARYTVDDTPAGFTIVVTPITGPATATSSAAPSSPTTGSTADTARRNPAPLPKVAAAPDAPAPARSVAPVKPAPPTRVAAVAPVSPVPLVTPTRPTAPVRPVARATAAALPAAVPAPVVVAQATAAPPADGITTSNGRRLISLDFKDADVVNLLRILAAESGRNIVVGDDVKGKMSISLRNVPWEQALDVVMETRSLQKIEKGNVIRIVTADQLTKERETIARVQEAKLKSEADSRTKMAEAQLKEAEALQRKFAAEASMKEAEARGPLREESIRLAYANPEEVAETLQGILGIPKEGQKLTGPTAIPGAPPIAEPPFSQLYGQQQGQAAPPSGGVISVSQDVLAKGLSIRAHKATNTIFLRLYAADLERIKKIIREDLDIPLPQVKIEARMEILDRNALEQIGIMWGGGAVGRAGSNTLVGQGFQAGTNLGQTVAAAPGIVLPDGSLLLDRTGVTPPGSVTAGSSTGSANPNSQLSGFLPVSQSTGLPLGGNLINLPISALPNAGPLPAAGLAFGIIASKFNVNLALQALSEQGKTRTLARPEIVTVENNKATMSLGEEIPYATVSSAGTQIQFKEALLKLEVTPTVIREGNVNKIKLIVIVENNSRGTVVNLGNSGNPPAINRRKAETQVLVREGERLVIGGVATSIDSNTVRKVPVLGDVPLLGWLFKQKENFEQGRELVVFVTPSVLRASDGTIPGLPPAAK